MKSFVLASTSPFRRDLLASTGLSFQCVGPKVNEKEIMDDDPKQLARLRAEAKALDVSKSMPDHLVLGADQVLSFAGKAFDKVKTMEAATERLKHLQGNVHQLHSAWSLVCNGSIVVSEVTDVSMPMRALSDEEVSSYAKTGEWQGSVGCYKFELKGRNLFEVFPADESAIVGLPLLPLLAALRKQGLHIFS